MKTIGRSDRVDLPELGLLDIHAKIDTGAFTSSLHCSQASIVNGKLEFVLLDDEHPEFTGMKFSVEEFTQREIKNSFGVSELRYIIFTDIVLFGEVIHAEFSLSDRDNLKFPILLGRTILRKRFLVDVARTNLSFKQKKKEAQKNNPL